MAIVKVEKNKYTVDKLYQWDLNQVLEIRGVSFGSAPEIHFTNEDMVRAVRVFSTMDSAGVIRATVPNSLLQKPYKITAYVCTREGEIFKSWYKIVIPVEGRNKPADYTITDDSDIYSFIELETLVKEATDQVEAVSVTATTAINIANAAANTANSIADTATEAKNTADNAKSTADSALTKAEEAVTAANAPVSRAALATDALYSPFVDIGNSEAYSFVVTDLGKTVACTGTAASSVVTLTMTKEVATALPYGAEIAVAWINGTAGIRIAFADDILSGMMGDSATASNRTYAITEKYGMAVLKKFGTSGNTYWLVVGNVEVVS